MWLLTIISQLIKNPGHIKDVISIPKLPKYMSLKFDLWLKITHSHKGNGV